MLRRLGVRFISKLAGSYEVIVNGETTVGSITGRLLGSRQPKWTAKGQITVSETVSGKKKLGVKLISDETELRVGAKGPLEGTAEIEESKGQTTLTHLHITKGLASLLGKEIDVSGISVSDLKVPLNIESEKEVTKVLGKVSADDLVSLPEIIRKMVGIFSNPLEVSAELSKTEEVVNTVQPSKK